MGEHVAIAFLIMLVGACFLLIFLIERDRQQKQQRYLNTVNRLAKRIAELEDKQDVLIMRLDDIPKFLVRAP